MIFLSDSMFKPKQGTFFWVRSLSDHDECCSEHSLFLTLPRKLILFAGRVVASGSESFADSRCEAVLVCVALARPSLVLAKRASPDATLFQL
ncbi:hypothetical protein QL285_028059 [Trifolium repens]|nr:hypothetical protein QL285_028059 [Trifolium repens]